MDITLPEEDWRIDHIKYCDKSNKNKNINLNKQ